MARVLFTSGMLDGVAKGPEITKRLLKGSPCTIIAVTSPVLGAALGLAVAAALGRSENWFGYLMAGLVLASFIGTRLCQRCAMGSLHKALKARGTPETQPYEIEVGPSGVAWRSDRLHGGATWAAVSELGRTGSDWLLFCDTTGLFIPRSGFAAEAEERAFVREALSHMSDEARARSPVAVAFAKGGGA